MSLLMLWLSIVNAIFTWLRINIEDEILKNFGLTHVIDIGAYSLPQIIRRAVCVQSKMIQLNASQVLRH